MFSLSLILVRNDITRMEVDAIVNAANSALRPGSGGVDRCIHEAAGPLLAEACRKLGGCQPGEAKITEGYRLPSRHVIHTVGPVWIDGKHGEVDTLASCYLSSLRLADDLHFETIAFPLIAAGAYGFPKELALQIATETIRDFLKDREMTVYLVVYSKEAFSIGQSLYKDIQSYLNDNEIPPAYTNLQGRRFAEIRRRIESYIQPQKAKPKAAPPVSSPKPKQKARRAPGSEPDFSRPVEGHASMDQELENELEAPSPSLSPLQEASSFHGVPVLLGDLSPDLSLEDYLQQEDESFRDMLLRKIDERGIKDSECYKKANVDRKLFNKIKNEKGYKTGKTIVLAFAVALELPLPEVQEMLSKAGYSLSHSSKGDLIVEYFIKRHVYDVYAINNALFDFDQSLLGSRI